MAGLWTKSEDVKDIACMKGDDSGLVGEKEKDVEFTSGNDSGLGEDTFTAEDILAGCGPKLMFRCLN